MGIGWPRIRNLDHLVPAGRRPLYRIHLCCCSSSDVCDRSSERLLRRALHDRRLPVDFHLHAPPLERVASAGLRHPGGLRPGALRQPATGTRGRGDRNHRDDALHRLAAGRHTGGARHDGDRRNWQCVRPRSAADRGLRRPRRLHLHVRAPGTGADRIRQGRSHLPRHHRRRRLDRREDRVRRGLRRGSGQDGQDQGSDVHPRQLDVLGLRHPRVRLSARVVHVPALGHGCAPARAATSYAETPRSCRPTH